MKLSKVYCKNLTHHKNVNGLNIKQNKEFRDNNDNNKEIQEIQEIREIQEIKDINYANATANNDNQLFKSSSTNFNSNFNGLNVKNNSLNNTNTNLYGNRTGNNFHLKLYETPSSSNKFSAFGSTFDSKFSKSSDSKGFFFNQTKLPKLK